MGGRIAMHFALQHPHWVRSLTLADTHEGFTYFTPEKRREFVETRLAPLLADSPCRISPAFPTIT
jgi:pimeloyl-ACP methyl ester carboxylesterase